METSHNARTLEYPRNSRDPEGIMKFAEDVREAAPSYRIDVERAAMANILFWLGLQWIKFDTNYRVWRPVTLKKRVPRMVTNKFATVVATSASRLTSYKPPLSMNPGSWEADDMAAAEVGDKIRTIFEKEAMVREKKPLAALWTLLTGNCFLISNYSVHSRNGMDFIPFDECLECQAVSSPVSIEETGGACPNCGSPQGLGFQMAMQEDGSPMGVNRPRGKHQLELKTLFECYYDYEVPMVEDSPYFLVSELQSFQWVKETYGAATAARVEGDMGEKDQGDYYLRSLAYTSSGSTRYISGSATVSEQRVRVTRLWMQPGDTYPNGLYAVILGKSEVPEAMDLPYHRQDGTPFVPVSHLKFDHVPGRVLGRTRADDIRPKQEQRNRIETILELHSRRMASSYWLVPDGSNVQRLTGEEGQLLRYSALAGVPPPTRVPGDNPPNYLINWLPQIDGEMDDLFGTKEILRGEVPEGVSAYSAISLIDERARQAQSSLMENWSLGWLKWTRDNVDIWREYADAERISNSGFGAWEIEKFSRAEMQGGVDISIESGENYPTTGIARRAALEQAARNGAFNMSDPVERYRYLESLGISNLMDDLKMHMRESERENDLVAQGQPIPPPMMWQEHGIHVTRHHRFMNSDKYRNSPPEAQAALFQHVMMHMQFIQQQMMQGTQLPGQVAPAGPGGPAGGSKGSAKGDQAGTDQEQADREAQGASPDTFAGGGGMS